VRRDPLERAGVSQAHGARIGAGVRADGAAAGVQLSSVYSVSSSFCLTVKRLSIEISDSLHREAKLAAMMDGHTLSSLVIDLLDAHLKARRAAQPHPMRRMSDFNPGVVREDPSNHSA